MKSNTEKQNQDKLQAPIADGDARPDQLNLDPQRKKPADEKQRVSKERGADINDADDFRDAKRP
jgi:hypothetical protein